MSKQVTLCGLFLGLSAFSGACALPPPADVDFDADLRDGAQIDAATSDDGGIDAGIDAAVDAMPGTWSAPVRQPSPSEAGHREDFPHVSPDGRELYVSGPGNDKFDSDNILRATRSLTTLPWGTLGDPVAFAEVINTISDQEREPFFSSDGLELFFSRGGFIFHTTRTSTSAAWQNATYAGMQGTQPTLLGDRLTLYYYDSTQSCPVDLCRMRVTRPTPTGAFGTPVLELFPAGGYQRVHISGDGLRALLSNPSSGAAAPVAVASRATPTSTWGTAVVIPELATYTNIRYARWTWDETQMYLAVDEGAGDYDIYVSTFQAP